MKGITNMCEELKKNLNKLKDEDAVYSFLHHIYMETVKGAILEVFTEENIFDAWADMQFFVDDIFTETDLLTDTERKDLIRFVNTVYLEFSEDKPRLKNSIIDIQNTLYKERGLSNGKSERRRDANCGRDTQRTSRNAKGNHTDR